MDSWENLFSKNEIGHTYTHRYSGKLLHLPWKDEESCGPGYQIAHPSKRARNLNSSSFFLIIKSEKITPIAGHLQMSLAKRIELSQHSLPVFSN